MPNFCCPNCGRDDQVQKVTSVITTQTWRGRDSDGDSITRVSELGKTLKENEPKKPWGYKTVLSLVIYLVILIFACAVSIPTATTDKVGAVILMTVITLIGLLVGFWGYRYWQTNVKQGEHKQKIEAWERALLRWNNLYYCFRDETIFVPNDSCSASLNQIHEYLYR